MKKLSNLELNKLSRQERYNYYTQLRNFEWSQKTWEEKKQSVLSDHHLLIGRRGVEEITLEEQIEFALNNRHSEKPSYVTMLVKHYNAIVLNEKFTFFWETKSPFSQWHNSNFKATTCLIKGVCQDNAKRKGILNNIFPFDEQDYTSAEQFMMYHKAIIFLDIDAAKNIMATHDVKKIKEFGRLVKGFDEKVWEFYRSSVVYEGNRQKFSQNQKLKAELFKTQGTTLVEAAPNDRIWGIGLTSNEPKAQKRATWQGKNLLGEILTKVRMDLIGSY